MAKIVPNSFLAMSMLRWIILGLAVLYGLYLLVVLGKYIMMYLTSRKAGAALGFGDLIRMRWQKLDPMEIIEAFDLAQQERLDLDIDQIQRHHAQGGRIFFVIEALALAKSRGIRTTWRDVCQRDLNGENVVEYIQVRIDRVEEPAGNG